MSASRGVPVRRKLDPEWGDHYTNGPTPDDDYELGTWYPVALAEAHERVIEAGRQVVFALIAKIGDPEGATDQYGEALAELMQAIAALDALEAQDMESGS